MNKNRGISGLDILVVVFLLGIIAAIVVPRFSNLHADAHRANNQGTAAALSAGIVFLQSKAGDNFDKPLPIHIEEDDYHYIIFNSKGALIGYGLEERNYRLLGDTEEGHKACSLVFDLLMRGKKVTAMSKEDYMQGGKKASYVAMGTRGEIYGGCKYLYLEGQPSRGKVYVVRYDANGGEVTVGIEDMPK